MSEINFNSLEGRALLTRIEQERMQKLDEIYKSFDDKTAERHRGFIDALDWLVEIPNENLTHEQISGDVYDCTE